MDVVAWKTKSNLATNSKVEKTKPIDNNSNRYGVALCTYKFYIVIARFFYFFYLTMEK